MKINLVSPSFYPATVYGGPIFSTLYTCRELSKLDNQIHVSTTNANRGQELHVLTNTPIDFEKGISVTYYNDTFKDRFSIPLALGIWKDIKKADIIHSQYIFSSPTPISLFYSNLLKKPYLLSPRGSFAPWILSNGIRLKKEYISLFIKPYNKKIWWHATSQQEKNEITDLFPSARVFTIPNGINLEESKSYTELTKEQFIKKFTGIEHSSPSNIIVSMGRLQKKKGFDILIDAFYKISEAFPFAFLIIAGQDEGEKVNLTKQIQALGLQHKAFVIDQINGEEKWTFLHNADLFVLPSHNENFGNVFAEALAAGTPIIASLNTPWKEIEENNCGKWVKNTPEYIAMAIKQMLTQDLSLMGENGKKFIQKFEWKNIALQFNSAFKTMLKKE